VNSFELTVQLEQEQVLQSPEQQLQEQGDMLMIGLDGYKPQKKIEEWVELFDDNLRA